MTVGSESSWENGDHVQSDVETETSDGESLLGDGPHEEVGVDDLRGQNFAISPLLATVDEARLQLESDIQETTAYYQGQVGPHHHIFGSSNLAVNFDEAFSQGKAKLQGMIRDAPSELSSPIFLSVDVDSIEALSSVRGLGAIFAHQGADAEQGIDCFIHKTLSATRSASSFTPASSIQAGKSQIRILDHTGLKPSRETGQFERPPFGDCPLIPEDADAKVDEEEEKGLAGNFVPATSEKNVELAFFELAGVGTMHVYMCLPNLRRKRYARSLLSSAQLALVQKHVDKAIHSLQSMSSSVSSTRENLIRNQDLSQAGRSRRRDCVFVSTTMVGRFFEFLADSMQDDGVRTWNESFLYLSVKDCKGRTSIDVDQKLILEDPRYPMGRLLLGEIDKDLRETVFRGIPNLISHCGRYVQMDIGLSLRVTDDHQHLIPIWNVDCDYLQSFLEEALSPRKKNACRRWTDWGMGSMVSLHMNSSRFNPPSLNSMNPSGMQAVSNSWSNSTIDVGSTQWRSFWSHFHPGLPFSASKRALRRYRDFEKVGLRADHMCALGGFKMYTSEAPSLHLGFGGTSLDKISSEAEVCSLLSTLPFTSLARTSKTPIPERMSKLEDVIAEWCVEIELLRRGSSRFVTRRIEVTVNGQSSLHPDWSPVAHGAYLMLQLLRGASISSIVSRRPSRPSPSTLIPHIRVMPPDVLDIAVRQVQMALILMKLGVGRLVDTCFQEALPTIDDAIAVVGLAENAIWRLIGSRKAHSMSLSNQMKRLIRAVAAQVGSQALSPIPGIFLEFGIDEGVQIHRFRVNNGPQSLKQALEVGVRYMKSAFLGERISSNSKVLETLIRDVEPVIHRMAIDRSPWTTGRQSAFLQDFGKTMAICLKFDMMGTISSWSRKGKGSTRLRAAAVILGISERELQCQGSYAFNPTWSRARNWMNTQSRFLRFFGNQIVIQDHSSLKASMEILFATSTIATAGLPAEREVSGAYRRPLLSKLGWEAMLVKFSEKLGVGQETSQDWRATLAHAQRLCIQALIAELMRQDVGDGDVKIWPAVYRGSVIMRKPGDTLRLFFNGLG